MGDRSYFEVWVFRDGLDRFCELPDANLARRQEETHAAVLFVDEAMNYGGQDLIAQAAADHCTFVGRHSAGDDYGAHLFYGRDGHYHMWEVSHHNNGLVIQKSRVPGKLDPTDIVEAESFLKTWAELDRRVRMTELEFLAAETKGGDNDEPRRVRGRG
jgi:hypothetical protein